MPFPNAPWDEDVYLPIHEWLIFHGYHVGKYTSSSHGSYMAYAIGLLGKGKLASQSRILCQVGWPGLIIVEGEERNVAASWFLNFPTFP